MNYKELVYLGLSEKEAKVYLSSLELGKSSVQNIAKKADINRATAYIVIESLMKKGLMSSIDENKKQYFMAEAPEKLKLLFQEQEIELQKRVEHLNKLLPVIKAIQKNDSDKPIVKYYEGREGVKAMVDDFLDTRDKMVRMIYPVDLLNKNFSDTERKINRDARLKKDIKTRVLYTYQDGELKSTPDGERRKISNDKYPIHADIALFEDKVRIVSLKNKVFGIVIENKDIADTFKSIFDLTWDYMNEIEEKK
jgi:HTH-type transcriptional regulator, sugar sensing transcriptional regulator